jgi:hypothetical protein
MLLAPPVRNYVFLLGAAGRRSFGPIHSHWLPMADIRLARPRGTRVWLWTGVLAFIGIALWASAFFVGDATAPEEEPRVGAGLDLGATRPAVLPAQSVPLQTLTPLDQRDLGRLVRLTGVAESVVRENAVWVRTAGGRRMLVRFEPAPPETLTSRFRPGSTLDLDGYLASISRAEFEVWMDTLNVRIPRPPPAARFGNLPDPAFARVDSLFIKNFYVSVRPEALQPDVEPDAES